MASGVNKVYLIGNLGKDPEVRYTPNGQPVANFSVAVSESWNDKQGQRQERTEWFRIVAFGKTAELCGEYLAKGRQVYVEGRLQTRQYEDREGKQRQSVEVVASNVVFLGSRGDAVTTSSSNGSAPRRSAPSNTEQSYSGGTKNPPEQSFDYGPPPSDDDVPFHHVPRNKKLVLPI